MDTTPCIEWPGTRDRLGYGRVSNVLAHRFVWELIHGPVPPGMCVCHHCDHPPCVRPDHLFVGTHTDNMRDMIQKGRAVHDLNVARGEYQGTSKLTSQEVLTIRERARPKNRVNGMGNLKALAKEFNVSYSLIWQIVKGRIWRHI